VKLIEEFKKDINNFLKEMQKNISKQVEALKEGTHTFLKEVQDLTIIQVKELNKTAQDLKMEVESLKKPQRETCLEMKNLGKRTGVTDASITNRIQEIEERIPVAEDTLQDRNITVKENTKSKNPLSQNIKKIQDTMKKPNLRIIGIE
jgi:chromosome segregation ATPase